MPETKSVPSYKNKKGTEYWFHKKGHLSFFSKDPKGAIPVPEGLFIKESSRTGMLFASKKK